ncbi:MAG TPA: DUF4824 family protein [Bryobacteraceae bacterium]|nr:DUF4824 family protein [Bryobacteraceae bacterium]
MKRASLIAAVTVVVGANIIAVGHGLLNRTGTPDADIVLTQRELTYYGASGSDDDSGVTLSLTWIDPALRSWPGWPEETDSWLNRQMLEKLGFNCSVDPSSADAGRFYERQRARRAFVALEYDGPAWQAWRETYDAAQAAQQQRIPTNSPVNVSSIRSHLVAVDADLDARQLRARHPDRGLVILVPAVIAVGLEPVSAMTIAGSRRVMRVRGRIQEIPSFIHVPQPFSEEFRRMSQRSPRTGARMTYRVHLRYGRLLEPWVVGVEFAE